MSSKARSVEHGGVTWKVIPGSRREQLLMRFIRQDNMLHHALPATPDVATRDFLSLLDVGIGVGIGVCLIGGLWWLL